jgi:hypothetical protein
MTKYQVVVMAEGKFFQYAPKDMFAFGEIGQYEFEGIEERAYLKPELQGQPKFKKLAGPMYGGEEDGVPVIRYESWEAYERMSA